MGLIEVIEEVERAATALDPVRLRLLRALARPSSGSALSREMGIPRQTVNYHLRLLEEHGLVELVEERRKGNCTERVLRATADAFVISPSALGPLGDADPDTVQDRFSAAYLIAALARTLRDVAVLRRRADRATKKAPTLTIQTQVRFRSADQRARFADELSDALARLVARYHDEGSEEGRRYSFMVAGHPTITERSTE